MCLVLIQLKPSENLKNSAVSYRGGRKDHAEPSWAPPGGCKEELGVNVSSYFIYVLPFITNRRFYLLL